MAEHHTDNSEAVRDDREDGFVSGESCNATKGAKDRVPRPNSGRPNEGNDDAVGPDAGGDLEEKTGDSTSFQRNAQLPDFPTEVDFDAKPSEVSSIEKLHLRLARLEMEAKTEKRGRMRETRRKGSAGRRPELRRRESSGRRQSPPWAPLPRSPPPRSPPPRFPLTRRRSRMRSLSPTRVYSSPRPRFSRSPSQRRRRDSSVERLRSIPKVNYISVEEYRSRKWNFVEGRHFTIDAVVDSTVYRSPTTSAAGTDNPSAGPDSTDPSAMLKEPIRFIQINSPALCSMYDYKQHDQAGYIILSPFKSLCFAEDQMRKQLTKLAEKWGTKTWEEVDSEVKPSLEPDTDAKLLSKKVDQGNPEAAIPPVDDGASKSETAQLGGEDATETQDSAENGVDMEHGSADSTAKPSTNNSKPTPHRGTITTAENDKSTDREHDDDVPTEQTSSEEPIKIDADRDECESRDSLQLTEDEAPPDVIHEGRKLLPIKAMDREEDSFKLYEDLKCILEFYDAIVKPRWDFFRHGNVKELRFSNLCMLFQPGDLVAAPNLPQKAWRVLKITGGRPVFEHLYTGHFNRTGDTRRAQEPVKSTEREVREPRESRDNFISPRANHGEEAKEGEVAKSGSSERGLWTSFHLDGYYIDFDGKEFGAVHVQARINYFPDEREVKSLRPFPLRFANESMRTDLRANGKRFMELTNVALRHYRGRTLTKRPIDVGLEEEEYFTARDVRHVRSEDVNSQVVVDIEKAFQNNSWWRPEFGVEDYGRVRKEFAEANLKEWDTHAVRPDNDHVVLAQMQYLEYYDQDQTSRYRQRDEWVHPHGEKSTTDRDRFEEDDLFILPDRAFGYILHTRSWACFDISPECLGPIPTENGYEELQLPQNHRRVLESLLERHFQKDHIDFDFIHGKGQGLVILLHGAPGTGKTSTVEAIASKYGKPLLPISNLGTDPETVERRLTHNFSLAQAWGCVVLLDEADLFLAKRTSTDIVRNALVTVFLRTLEYYTGVLFLTTNRTGTIDEAFRSRIHHALFYPDFQLYETEQIWRSNLMRLMQHKDKNGQTIHVNEEGGEIIRYARVLFKAHEKKRRGVWNGRQIRNSFQSAVALAQYDAKQENKSVVHLDWKHFEAVALASAQFEDYLGDTHGFSDAEMLDQTGVRANYAPPGSLFGDAGRGRRPDTTIQDSIRDLHPNSLIQDEIPFANDPFSRGGLQKRPTLGQRAEFGSSSSQPAASWQQHSSMQQGSVQHHDHQHAYQSEAHYYAGAAQPQQQPPQHPQYPQYQQQPHHPQHPQQAQHPQHAQQPSYSSAPPSQLYAPASSSNPYPTPPPPQPQSYAPSPYYPQHPRTLPPPNPTSNQPFQPSPSQPQAAPYSLPPNAITSPQPQPLQPAAHTLSHLPGVGHGTPEPGAQQQQMDQNGFAGTQNAGVVAGAPNDGDGSQ